MPTQIRKSVGFGPKVEAKQNYQLKSLKKQEKIQYFSRSLLRKLFCIYLSREKQLGDDAERMLTAMEQICCLTTAVQVQLPSEVENNQR